MKDQLDAYNVEIVAISKDTPQEVRNHIARDGVKSLLLSDADLSAIRTFGLEHHKALGAATPRRSIFGFPLATSYSFKTMAIPTTLLIDETGTIRWLDQSDDYRLRSDNNTIMTAIKTAFT